ncbi:MAG: sigma-54 dependent transcriptional regulator [Thermodesulfobacteriota bacterium]
MHSVLIVDDDEILCRALSHRLACLGYQVETALTLTEGLERVLTLDFDVVLLDVYLPDGNGLEALPKIRQAPSEPEVIIFTARGNPAGAELAIKSGAWDYIQKPSSLNRMVLPLIRALQYRETRWGHRPIQRLNLQGLVGSSPVLKSCLDLVAHAAQCEANVLITGETGTGKELIAAAIHHNSPHKGANFVVVDCAVLPETLVESILFGHEKGSFTGADRERQGLVKQAHQGTLFLDEVGELPLSLQKSFLRVIETGRFRPLGAKTEMESSFRLIAATNRNLDHLVGQGRFREDLLFRLRGISIEVPPLRDRPDDIRELTSHYLNHLAERDRAALKNYTPEFLEALEAYYWPGNIRELKNALEQAVAIAADSPTLFPSHLPTEMRIHLAQASLGERPRPSGPATPPVLPEPAPADFTSMRDFQDRMERQYLNRLMDSVEGSVSEACRISGISRSTLYRLLKKHQQPSKPEGDDQNPAVS